MFSNWKKPNDYLSSASVMKPSQTTFLFITPQPFWTVCLTRRLHPNPTQIYLKVGEDDDEFWMGLVYGWRLYPSLQHSDSQHCNSHLESDHIGKVIYHQIAKFKDSGFATLRSKLHLIDWGIKSNRSIFIWRQNIICDFYLITKVVSLTPKMNAFKLENYFEKK